MQLPIKLTKSLAGASLTKLRIKTYQRILVLLLAVILGGICCSEDQIDFNDELGMENDNSGKVTIVNIDSTVIGSNGRDRESNFGNDVEYKGKGKEPTGTDHISTRSDVISYDPEGDFTVQVGVFSTAREAGQMVLTLSSMGYPAYSIAQPDGKGIRVRIGYFVSRNEAVSFGEIFKEDSGSDYWIDRRINEF